jgi:hypothetical protein
MTEIACWSPKGKQIVCGLYSGELEQYTPNGRLQRTIPTPNMLSSLSAGK